MGRTMLQINVDSKKLAELGPALTQLVEGLARLEATGGSIDCSMESGAVPPLLEEHEIFEPDEEEVHVNGKSRPWGKSNTAMGRLRAALTAMPETLDEFRAGEIYSKLPKEVRPRDASELSAMLVSLCKSGFLIRKQPGIYIRPSTWPKA